MYEITQDAEPHATPYHDTHDVELQWVCGCDVCADVMEGGHEQLGEDVEVMQQVDAVRVRCERVVEEGARLHEHDE